METRSDLEASNQNHEFSSHSLFGENVNVITIQHDFFKQLAEAGKSENTLKNYKTDLSCFNHYLLENQKNETLDKIGLGEVLEYGKYLENRYKSDNSRRRRVQALRIFFDYLVKKGFYPSNIVKKVPTSPKFLDRPRPSSFSDVKTLWMYLLEEEQKAKGLQRIVQQRNQLIFLLIFGGGLKVSDVSGLKKEDLILSDEPKVLVHPPKRDPYTVPLPRITYDVASKYLQSLKAATDSYGLEFDELLFNANAYRILSGGISTRGLEVLFEELREKLVLKITPKSLRQACIFKWLHQSHPETLIKEWMGVAPSYSLKSYRLEIPNHIYNDLFLTEFYKEFSK